MKKVGSSKRVRSRLSSPVERYFDKFGRVSPKTRMFELYPQAIKFGQSDMPDEIADAAPEAPARRRRRELQTSRKALVAAAFEAATTSELRHSLLQGRGIAAVVTVPHPSWVQPVKGYLADLRQAEFCARDGSEKIKNPAEDNEGVASALARGQSVVGISPSPERYLPSLIVTSADVHISIAPPSPKVIAAAMRRCLRGKIPPVPDGVGAGLEFGEIIAALREGSKPADALARLQAIGRARTKVNSAQSLPTLEEAVFYGAARDWGLALAADVAAVRRGEIGWGEADRGACFFGPAGTGKSWLAAIIASACGLPLISASIADLFATSAGFLDSVIKAQRAVFARAAAMAPCILQWDELDALPNRATLSPRGRDWWTPVIEDFMIQVAATPQGVITIACTNRLQDIDEAMLRPGRLERTILVEPPATAEGLAGILRFHLGSDLVGTDIVPLARVGLGATPAQAMEWVRAARRTARRSKRNVTGADLLSAIAPPDTRTPEALFLSAAHEAGHAVAAIVLGTERIQQLSLVRKQGTGGAMTLAAAINLGTCGRDDIEKYAIVSLAGRAAEIVIFGEPSGGAAGDPNSDLGLATRMVASIHASLGLGDSLVYRCGPQKVMKILERDHTMRERVEHDLQRLQRLASELVRKYRHAVEEIADALVTRRFMTGAEVQQVFDAACAQTVIPRDPRQIEGKSA
jgi:hypothetical protein